MWCLAPGYKPTTPRLPRRAVVGCARLGNRRLGRGYLGTKGWQRCGAAPHRALEWSALEDSRGSSCGRLGVFTVVGFGGLGNRCVGRGRVAELSIHAAGALERR